MSIPAMATECERTFISAKKLITPERNAAPPPTDTNDERQQVLATAVTAGTGMENSRSQTERSTQSPSPKGSLDIVG